MRTTVQTRCRLPAAVVLRVIIIITFRYSAFPSVKTVCSSTVFGRDYNNAAMIIKIKINFIIRQRYSKRFFVFFLFPEDRQPGLVSIGGPQHAQQQQQ